MMISRPGAFTGTGQTIGAVTSTLSTYDCALGVTNKGTKLAVLNNQTILIEATILGISGSDVAVLRYSRVYKRIAGTLSAVAAQAADVADVVSAALAGVAAVLTLSGDTIQIQATGIGGTTIDWTAQVRVSTSNV
jgi:hypothetical protein